MLIIDKAKNSTCRIWQVFHDSDGTDLTPDTSLKITIYAANDTATPTVAETDMTAFATGQLYYAFNCSSVNPGNYVAKIVFTHATSVYSLTEHILVIDGTSDKAVIAAENAAALLDHDVTDHTTADTVGEALNHLDADVSGAGQGNGGYEVVFYSQDANGVGIQGVQVYCTSDAAGATVVTGNQYSLSDQGQTTWFLDLGATYYFWQFKEGRAFNNPTTHTVTGA